MPHCGCKNRDTVRLRECDDRRRTFAERKATIGLLVGDATHAVILAVADVDVAFTVAVDAVRSRGAA